MAGGKGIYRTVDVMMWTADLWYADLDPLAKLVFLNLITNHRQTPAGAFAVRLGDLARETGIGDDEMADILARRLAEKVTWWPDLRWVFVRNFYARQLAHSNPTTYRVAARKAVVAMPAAVGREVGIRYPDLAGTTHPPAAPDADGGTEGATPLPTPPATFTRAAETVTESATVTAAAAGEISAEASPAGDGDTPPAMLVPLSATPAPATNGTHAQAEPEPADPPPWPNPTWVAEAFEGCFWPMYPRKTNKAESGKLFAALMRHQRDYDAAHDLLCTIMEALNVQRTYWTDPKFTPHPATYLRGRRWEDEIVIPTGPARRRAG